MSGFACLVAGLVPVLFLDAARRAGSIGKLSAVGLMAIAAIIVVIATASGVLIGRAAIRKETMTADVWISSFLAVAVWSVGVLTLVPGLVFLRLSDNRSLNDHGAWFFFEWAFIYILIAAAAYGSGRFALRSLSAAKAPVRATHGPPSPSADA